MTANSPASTVPDTTRDEAATTILLVEDEKDLHELLRYNLAREGYQVLSAETGEAALKIIKTQTPDLILLDLMLPGMDGVEVCRSLREKSNSAHIPVIMLTAKGEESDVVAGLDAGADDYVTKPFSPRILLARIQAVLRRGVVTQTAKENHSSVFEVKNVRLDHDRHEVTVNGEPIDLTATEFKLLTLMVGQPGRVFTRQGIIERIHEGYAAVTDRSVDVQVVALRRKLGDAGRLIETVRGVGYRFRD